MATTVSATEAARGFSDLLNRVRYEGEEFLVERGGEPVCRISPVGGSRTFTARQLMALLQGLPAPDAAYLDELEELLRDQPLAAETPWPR